MMPPPETSKPSTITKRPVGTISEWASKAIGPLGVDGQFGHFVPADENFVLLARDGFERRGVDHFFDRLDLAIDLLRGEFEFVESCLSETVSGPARTTRALKRVSS